MEQIVCWSHLETAWKFSTHLIYRYKRHGLSPRYFWPVNTIRILDIFLIHNYLWSNWGSCPTISSVDRMEIGQQNGPYCTLLMFVDTQLARDLLHSSSWWSWEDCHGSNTILERGSRVQLSSRYQSWMERSNFPACPVDTKVGCPTFSILLWSSLATLHSLSELAKQFSNNCYDFDSFSDQLLPVD